MAGFWARIPEICCRNAGVRKATITGWGKCMPPAVLSNDDIATFLDTDDEWITSRTGIRERRISHVSLEEMGTVAAQRALACAGLEADDIEEYKPNKAPFRWQAPAARRRGHVHAAFTAAH
jgi:3-oxoacyl-[acyl-carrier-protein] synthase III